MQSGAVSAPPMQNGAVSAPLMQNGIMRAEGGMGGTGGRGPEATSRQLSPVSGSRKTATGLLVGGDGGFTKSGVKSAAR